MSEIKYEFTGIGQLIHNKNLKVNLNLDSVNLEHIIP